MSNPTQPFQQPYGEVPGAQPGQPVPPPGPPPKPPKRKRFGWIAMLVAAAVALVLGIAIGGGSKGTTTAAPTAAVTVTAAPAPAPTVTVTAPGEEPASAPSEPPSTEPKEGGSEPKASDWKIKIKVLSKECFGSAGCSVTFRIDPQFVGDAWSYPDTGTLEVTYEITGGDDGAATNTFEVDLSTKKASFTEQESASIEDSDDKLKAKITDVSLREW
jgi:hypothetical protein